MQKINNIEIGQRISRLRRDKGKTQAEMANALNVARSTFSKWEIGGATISIQDAAALADCFEISLDELLTGNKPAHAELVSSLGLTSRAIETLKRIKSDADKFCDEVKIVKKEDENIYNTFTNDFSVDARAISAINTVLSLPRGKMLFSDIQLLFDLDPDDEKETWLVSEDGNEEFSVPTEELILTAISSRLRSIRLEATDELYEEEEE